MTDNRIARRYASAAFKLGEAEGGDTISKRGQTLVALEGLLDESPALDRVFKSPIITKYGEEAKEVGGHGGMDFIEDSRLVYCLRNGLPLDMDVYDLAEWCCLAELGSISMDHGNIPVQVPDFTRGLWNKDKGFRHAFASPEEEAATEASGKAFTAKLKEQGKKYWDKVAKQEAKAAKKAQKAKK